MSKLPNHLDPATLRWVAEEEVKCATVTCNEEATRRVFWPGFAPVVACFDCSRRIVASTVDVTVFIESLDGIPLGTNCWGMDITFDELEDGCSKSKSGLNCLA